MLPREKLDSELTALRFRRAGVFLNGVRFDAYHFSAVRTVSLHQQLFCHPIPIFVVVNITIKITILQE